MTTPVDSTATATTTATTTTTTKIPIYHYSWKSTCVIVLLIANILFLSLLTMNIYSTTSFIIPFHQQSQMNVSLINNNTDTDDLEAVLRRASMGDNKTVIIAVVNKAYVENEVKPHMFDLFLEGFWEGEGTRELVNYLVIVAVDQTSYDRCLFLRLHCYRLSMDGLDPTGEAVFMSEGFINLMWRRTFFLIQVLKKGYSFTFTDTDVLWLRNPFPILLANAGDVDIQFSADIYIGGPLSVKDNKINTGFYFVRSNEKTISLYEKWYGSKDKYPRSKEQDVIQTMAWEGGFSELGIKAKFLDTIQFNGICQWHNSDTRRVVTLHANCCRFIRAKVTDLTKVLHEWIQFRDSPPNAKKPLHWSYHKACRDSWRLNG